MALAPFLTNAGSPNPPALMEQMGLVQCIYRQNPVAYDQILAAVAGGLRTLFVADLNVWPPSYAICQDGNNYFVHIAGTCNIEQWWGNVTGAFRGPYLGQPLIAHQFFLSAWINIATSIRDALGDNWQSGSLSFVGHSLGAAVALFGALEYANNFPALAVRFLGFATPKIMTAGYTGAPPIPCITVATSGDAVPNTPPTNHFLSIGALGATFWGIPSRWTHYESLYRTDSFGEITALPVGGFDYFPSLVELAQTATVHLPTYYSAQQCSTYVLNGTANPGDDMVFRILYALNNGTWQQNQNVQMVAPGGVDLPLQNEHVFLQPPTLPLTPGNVAEINTVIGEFVFAENASAILAGETTMANAAVKIVFTFADNLGAFSDTWYMPTGPATTFNPSLLQTYVVKRLALSGMQTSFQKVRVSTIGTPRQARSYFPSDFSLTPATVVGSYRNPSGDPTLPTDAPFTAIMVNKISTSTIGRWFLAESRMPSWSMAASSAAIRPGSGPCNA